MVFSEVRRLDVCLDRTRIRAIVIVAPGGADEGRGRFVWRMVNDSNTAFGMFVPKFGDEREIACTVDVGLDLGN